MNQKELKIKLFDAIEKNDFNKINDIINTDINLYEYKDEFRLSIFYANLEMIEYWVKKGANVHDDDEWAVKWAVKNNNNEVFKYLITQNVDLSVNKNELLDISIEKYNIEIASYLLKNHTFMKKHLKNMPSHKLINLIKNDNLDLLELIFNSGYIFDPRENNELIKACEFNSIKILTWLIEKQKINFYIDSDYCLKSSARYKNFDTTFFLYTKYNDKEKAMNIIKNQGDYKTFDFLEKYNESEKLSNQLVKELHQKDINKEEIKITKLKI